MGHGIVWPLSSTPMALDSSGCFSVALAAQRGGCRPAGHYLGTSWNSSWKAGTIYKIILGTLKY